MEPKVCSQSVRGIFFREGVVIGYRSGHFLLILVVDAILRQRNDCGKA